MCIPDLSHDWTTIACSCCGDTFKVPVYCGDRFCDVCAPRRLSRIRRRLIWLTSIYKVPVGKSYKHLTLTISSQVDLSDMVSEICKSFRKLRQRKIWRKNVAGGAFVVEITHNENGWHAHIHAVVVANFIDYFKLLAAWKSVSSGQGVYIQKIPQRQVVGYLTKYMTKPGKGVDDSQLVSQEMKGVRMFSPFGDWYSLNATYEPPPTLCQKCGGGSFIPLSYIDRYDRRPVILSSA